MIDNEQDGKVTISDFLEFLNPRWDMKNEDLKEGNEELGLKLIGNILKAELWTLRNIRDWAGDISKEKDFINTSIE